MQELEQAIETRKQMIKKTDYECRDDNRLGEQLKVARFRCAELQVQFNDSKHLLKKEMERNADFKLMNWRNNSAESEKEEQKQPKRRTTRK